MKTSADFILSRLTGDGEYYLFLDHLSYVLTQFKKAGHETVSRILVGQKQYDSIVNLVIGNAPSSLEYLEQRLGVIITVTEEEDQLEVV